MGIGQDLADAAAKRQAEEIGPTPMHEANNVDMYGREVPPCLSKELYRLRLKIDGVVQWRVARKVMRKIGVQVGQFGDESLWYDAHHGLFWAADHVTIGGDLHLIEPLPDRSTWESPDGKLIPPEFTTRPLVNDSEKLPTGWFQRWLDYCSKRVVKNPI